MSAFIAAFGNKIRSRMETTEVLHVVFDRYNALSIKSACRTACQDGCSCVFKLSDESTLPKQALILNVATNKGNLIRLIVKHLCALVIPQGKRQVVTGPDPHPIVVDVGVQSHTKKLTSR